MIGLTEELPINTLFGLPFIMKAQFAAHFHQNAVTSDFFKQEFVLSMECPRLLPPEHIGHNQTAETKVFSTNKGANF